METETKRRMTEQRKKILEVLKNTTCHPTADWIYEQVKKDIPNISLGTVYRNLNILAEMDEIMVLEFGSDHSRFDGNPEEHYHFHCEQCDSVYDIEINLKEKLNKKINNNTQFKAYNHRLEFYGVCPTCQNQNE